MEMTTLGRTGLEVSRIAFGTWQVSGQWGSYDADQAKQAIRRAYALGINLFDTAQAYGFGRSESLLGQALRDELDHDRESVVLATKGGITPGGARPRDSSREYLRSGVESSLTALGVDYIDIYQVHWPDERTPYADTAGYLQEMVDEGKIRHVGVSNFDERQLAAFAQRRPAETLQPPYSLFRRGIEDAILPYARTHGIGVLAYSPLASGLLTGSIDTNTSLEDSDWRSRATAFHGEELRRNLAVVDRLKALASDKGVGVAQLAVAWVLAQDGIDCAIVGARSAHHIEAAIDAAQIPLDQEELAQIARIVDDGVQIGGASPEGVD